MENTASTRKKCVQNFSRKPKGINMSNSYT